MDSNTFRTRTRTRLVDELAEFLREQIYSGKYPPGMQLRQERLAEELDVSRTPLREALRILENEGTLTSVRGNRVEVISLDKQRFFDALVLREVVDGAAARLSAEARTPKLERALARALDKQRSAIDPWDRAQFAAEDADFHRHIYEASQNPYVEAQLPLVRLSIQVFQLGQTFFGEHRAEPVLDHHERIAAAIGVGDPNAAEQASRAHIQRVMRELREHGAPLR